MSGNTISEYHFSIIELAICFAKNGKFRPPSSYLSRMMAIICTRKITNGRVPEPKKR